MRNSLADPVFSQDWTWKYWFLVPIYPYAKRRTIRREVVPDSVWTFEQLQGILYVIVPIRMTVVRLERGGLLVYAPVAPTRECVALVRELEAKYGEVKYIILPTISGIEHKVFVAPFARRFPQAEIFVTPDQWSYPLNLPLNWLGLPKKRTRILPKDSSKTPFADQFEYAILDTVELGVGKFAEVAFLDRRSQTLLVTDTVISIPEEPPAILQLDPYPLLFHAKDDAFDVIKDTPENRRKGWQRISLFALYFRPSALEVVEMGQSLRDAIKAPDRSKKAYFGWYPFRWQANWQRSFNLVRGRGALLVAPILQTLILNRAPQETLEWANRVASWYWQRIIPCHFDAPITTEPLQFRQAFAFLEKYGIQSLPEADFELLREIDAGLKEKGITPPAKEKV